MNLVFFLRKDVRISGLVVLIISFFFGGGGGGGALYLESTRKNTNRYFFGTALFLSTALALLIRHIITMQISTLTSEMFFVCEHCS